MKKQISISTKALCLAIIGWSCISYLLGRSFTNSDLYRRYFMETRTTPSTISKASLPVPTPTPASKTFSSSLPDLIMIDGKQKQIPSTKYTEVSLDSKLHPKHLRTKLDQTDHTAFLENDRIPPMTGQNESNEISLGTARSDESKSGKKDDVKSIPGGKILTKTDSIAAEYLPSGQHLLVDIKNVDGTFLNSEKRLARAMVDVVVKEAKLTLLSCHCYKLKQMGVSCVGILLQSHIALHTWPELGVITLDLYTCGPGDLVPLMPTIEKLFAIPQEKQYEGDIVDEPQMVWTHKLRGFRSTNDDEPYYLNNDIGSRLLESAGFDFKVKIASAHTDFQRVDLFDTIEATRRDILSHEKSHSDDGSYESQHPECFQLQRYLFLDGALRSTREGVEAYHEAFVQPGMFMHRCPKRVAIVGGGEGGILREVLKHKTVEKVKMIEMDKDFVRFSREYLPCWNKCSDLVGSTDCCGDDNRAEILYEDAVTWFNERFSLNSTREEEPYDVLIVDSIDPYYGSSSYYVNRQFVHSLYNALNDDGIIIFQLGAAPSPDEPHDEFNRNKWRVLLLDLLEEVGFESTQLYEDGHGGLRKPWMFLIAAKDDDCRTEWYRSQAQLDVAIHKRILRTYSGTPALKYFDSGQMRAIMYPHKNFEKAFCRAVPTPESCQLITRENERGRKPNVPVLDLEVRISGAGEHSGRGLFTCTDIAKGSTIGRKDSARVVEFYPDSTKLVEKYMGTPSGADLSKVHHYLEGYGWDNNVFGPGTMFIDSSILTFSNHGCNGTFNIGDIYHYNGNPYSLTEQTANQLFDFDYNFGREFYDPAYDRHEMAIEVQNDEALRDIKAGEELLYNYIGFVANKEDWLQIASRLRALCNRGEPGIVAQVEEESVPNKINDGSKMKRPYMFQGLKAEV